MAGLFDRARERVNQWTRGDDQELQSADDQSDAEKALVAFVDQELELRRSAASRVAMEAIALTNTAYLCGFDSVYFDGTARQFKPIPAPSQLIARHRVHVNRILPTCQNRLARLTKNEPRWEVKPNSSDQEDKDAARLSQEILIQLFDQLQISQKRAPLFMWLQQAGSSFLKVCWDPTLGKKKVLPVDKTEEDGSTTRTYELVAEGDIRVDVASFFEVFPDPLAMYWGDCKSIIQAKIRPLSYFKDQYKERGHLVKEEDCWLNSLQYEARINALNTQTGASGMSTNQLKDSAIERMYDENPSSKHPMGRRIITANGILLKEGVLPVDELPWVKFDDIIIGGKFISEAIITHLRPLQDQINRGKSMRAAWMNRTLTGKITVPRGANLGREAYNDQSGEVLVWDPVPNAPNSGQPMAFEVPVIPAYAYEEESVLKIDMDDTAGINEASRGQMPSAQIPAIGMQLLVEQDDTRIGTETESHEHSFANLGRILLKFVDKYYELPRLLKTSGKGMEYIVREFRGSDIRQSFDVHVKRGSLAPGSTTLKRQEIMNMHQAGYFGNPMDPLVLQNVLDMLEFGDEYQAWKTHSLRMKQIKRGIEMIEKDGAKPSVSEFDDHALWLQELNDYRLEDKFLLLSADQQTIVLELMNEHADFLQDMSAPQPDPEGDPELAPTTAAQQAEAQVSQQPLPPDTAGASLQASLDRSTPSGQPPPT